MMLFGGLFITTLDSIRPFFSSKLNLKEIEGKNGENCNPLFSLLFSLLKRSYESHIHKKLPKNNFRGNKGQKN